MASKVVPSVTGTTEGLERPAANGGPRVAWAAAISSRDPAPGPKEGARASQPPPPPLPVIHSPASAKLASASKGTGAGGGWGLFRGHHAAQHAARSGRGSATAVLAASAMAGTLRRQQKARALGSVGANTWGPGAAERRGVRARGGEEKMRLQEKLWTKLRDAKELPGIRGWAFRRGLPILGATLFVVDVVSDAVLAKNLFGNGYTRLGTLTLVFMLAHYVPTYFMILRAANQSFYAAHVLLLSGSTAGAAPGAAGDASAASAASASALPAIGAVARLQEAIHLFFYVLLVIFGLLLVPFIDVYMVLSAFVLSVDHGDAGYTMRTAEDFCRQYERARLPLECFLESLPQTALQVVLTVSLLGSVCNLILVSWEMYNAWRSSGDTFLEYLDPLIRLQGSTKVPIEAQNAMLERVAEHVRRVEERERSDAASGGGNGTGGGSSSDSGPPGGGGALVPLPSRKRGSGSGLPNGAAGADCDSGSEDEIEDEAWERADQAPGHRSLRAISFLEKVDPSAAAAARARGLPPSLVFVLGGAGDHIYSSLSAFQRRSLMDVLSSYSKVRLPALRALQMQQVDPSVASRLLRKVVALPPHLRLVGGGQGRRGGGGNLIPPSFYNIVVQVLPQAALEVHPEAPMLDLQLSKLVLTGQYTSSASGSSLQAYSNSVAVGWALAQVLIAQPQLCRVLLDECDVYVPAMLDALDKELEAEAEYRARAPVTETKAAVTAADLEAAARAAAAEAAAGACEGSGDGDETTVQPSARHAPDVMKAALAAAAMMRASAAARGMEEPASGDATAEGAPVPDGRLVRLAQYAALARLREAAGPRLLVVVHPEGGSEIEKRLEERARRGGALQQPLHAAGDRKPAAQRPGASGELRELHLVPSYRPRGMNIDSKVLLVPCPRSPALLSMLSSALSAVLAPSRLVLSHSDLHAEDCASIGATLAFNRSIETLELQATGLGVEALAHMLPGLQVHSTLTSLDLSANAIGDAGVEAVAGVLSHLPNLTTLILAKCGMGTRGSDAVAGQLLALAAQTQLQDLDFHENPPESSTPAMEWLSFLYSRHTAKQAKGPPARRLELNEVAAGGAVIPQFGSSSETQQACARVMAMTPAAALAPPATAPASTDKPKGHAKGHGKHKGWGRSGEEEGPEAKDLEDAAALEPPRLGQPPPQPPAVLALPADAAQDLGQLVTVAITAAHTPCPIELCLSTWATASSTADKTNGNAQQGRATTLPGFTHPRGAACVLGMLAGSLLGASPTNLVCLDLSGAQVVVSTAAPGTTVPTTPSMGPAAGAAAAAAAAAATAVSALEHLCLGLERNNTLRELRLAGCGLDDDAAIMLCAAIARRGGCAALRRLELHANPGLCDRGMLRGVVPLLQAAAAPPSAASDARQHGKWAAAREQQQAASGGAELVVTASIGRGESLLQPGTVATLLEAATKLWVRGKPRSPLTQQPRNARAVLLLRTGDAAVDRALAALVERPAEAAAAAYKDGWLAAARELHAKDSPADQGAPEQQAPAESDVAMVFSEEGQALAFALVLAQLHAPPQLLSSPAPQQLGQLSSGHLHATALQLAARAAEGASRIMALNLEGSVLGTVGATALAAALRTPALRHLRRLGLVGCRLDDSGLTAICRALVETGCAEELEALDLQHNPGVEGPALLEGVLPLLHAAAAATRPCVAADSASPHGLKVYADTFGSGRLADNFGASEVERLLEGLAALASGCRDAAGSSDGTKHAADGAFSNSAWDADDKSSKGAAQQNSAGGKEALGALAAVAAARHASRQRPPLQLVLVPSSAGALSDVVTALLLPAPLRAPRPRPRVELQSPSLSDDELAADSPASAQPDGQKNSEQDAADKLEKRHGSQNENTGGDGDDEEAAALGKGNSLRSLVIAATSNGNQGPQDKGKVPDANATAPPPMDASARALCSQVERLARSAGTPNPQLIPELLATIYATSGHAAELAELLNALIQLLELLSAYTPSLEAPSLADEVETLALELDELLGDAFTATAAIGSDSAAAPADGLADLTWRFQDLGERAMGLVTPNCIVAPLAGDAQAVTLAAALVQQQPRAAGVLRTLDLNGSSGLGETGLAALAFALRRSAAAPRVRELRLAGVVDSAGDCLVEALAQVLPQLRSLTALDVSGSSHTLSEATLELLAAALQRHASRSSAPEVALLGTATHACNTAGTDDLERQPACEDLADGERAMAAPEEGGAHSLRLGPLQPSVKLLSRLASLAGLDCSTPGSSPRSPTWFVALASGNAQVDELCSAIGTGAGGEERLGLVPGISSTALQPTHIAALAWAYATAGSAATAPPQDLRSLCVLPMAALLLPHRDQGVALIRPSTPTAGGDPGEGAAASGETPSAASSSVAALLWACGRCGALLVARAAADAAAEQEDIDDILQAELERHDLEAAAKPATAKGTPRAPAQLPSTRARTPAQAAAGAAFQTRLSASRVEREHGIPVRPEALTEADAAALALGLLPGSLGREHRLDFSALSLSEEGLRVLLLLLGRHGSTLKLLSLAGQTLLASSPELQRLLCATELPALHTLQQLDLRLGGGVGLPDVVALADALAGLGAPAGQLRRLLVDGSADAKALKATGRLPAGLKCWHRGKDGGLSSATVEVLELLLSDDERNIAVIDPYTGKQLAKFSTSLSDYSIIFLHCTADCSKLVTGSSSGDVHVYDAAEGKLLQKLSGHRRTCNAAMFSPNGSQIVSCSFDKSIKVYDSTTYKCTATFIGHDDDVNSMAMSADGTQVASTADDGKVVVHDLATGKVVSTCSGTSSLGWRVDFHPQGHQVASGHRDGTVQVIEVATGKVLHTLKGHSGEVMRLRFHPGGSVLVTGSDKAELRVWSVATGALVAKLPPSPGVGEELKVRGIDFLRDGKLMVVACGKWLYKWSFEGVLAAAEAADAAANQASSAEGPGALGVGCLEEGLTDSNALCEVLWPASSGLYGVAASADGRLLASATKDGLARVHNTDTGAGLDSNALSDGQAVVSFVLLSPDGTTAVIGGDNGRLSLHDLPSGRLRKRLPGHGANRALEATRLLSGSNTGDVLSHNLDDGSFAKLEGHSTCVWCIDASPHDGGAFAATGSHDKSVRIWEVATGKTEAVLQADSPRPVHSVAWSPSGTHVVAMDDGRAVSVWSVASKSLITTLVGHEPYGSYGGPTAFTPDGRFLLSASNGEYPGSSNNASKDRIVRIWDFKAGRVLAGVPHPAQVTSLAVAPPGRNGGEGLLVTGCWDGRVRVFNLETLTEVDEEEDEDAPQSDPRAAAAGAAAKPKAAGLFWRLRVPLQLRLPLDCTLRLRVHSDVVWSLCFSPDGGRMLSTSRDGTMLAWTLGCGDGAFAQHSALEYKPPPESGAPHTAAASLPSAEAAAHEAPSTQPAAAAVQKDHFNTAVCYSPDGRMVASTSGRGNAVRLWLLAAGGGEASSGGGAVEATGYLHLVGHAEQVMAVAWSPDSRMVASGSCRGAVLLHDVSGAAGVASPAARGSAATGAAVPCQSATATLVPSSPAPPPASAAAAPAPQPVAVQSLDWSPGGLLAVCFSDGAVRLYGVRAGGALATPPVVLQPPAWAPPATCVRFSPNASLIAAAGPDGAVYLYDTGTGVCRGLLPATATSWAPAHQVQLEPPQQLDEGRIGSAGRLGPDAFTLEYTGGDDDGPCCAQADGVIPSLDGRGAKGVFYFEAKIVNAGAKSFTAIGFAPPDYDLSKMPGWESDSMGYHGDDGRRFLSSGRGPLYGPTFGTGDVVGAGLDVHAKQVFWTKNGTQLATVDVAIPSRLVPSISAEGAGAVVRINLGQEPFRFDVASFKPTPPALPSRLNPERVGPSGSVDDGFIFKHAVTDSAGCCAQADAPVPSAAFLDKGIFYFEMAVMERDKSYVAIGFTPAEYDLKRVPGRAKGVSFGYHGDDGKMYHKESEGHSFGGSKYGAGDVVGAGLDLVKSEIFFTKNGEKYDNVPVKLVEGLYPTVSAVGPGKGAVIKANFGAEPFQFDIAAFRTSSVRTPAAPATQPRRPPASTVQAVSGGKVTRESARVGMKVVRGPDWDWGDQDGGEGNVGTIYKLTDGGWTSVKWDKSGSTNNYRVAGNYDLTEVGGDPRPPELAGLLPQLQQGRRVTKESARVGMKVVRGKDWKWSDQDGGAGKVGTIVELDDMWTSVRWDENEDQFSYRVGHEGCYDLQEVQAIPQVTPDVSGLQQPQFGCMAFAPGGEVLAVLAPDKTVRIWRLDTAGGARGGEGVRGQLVGKAEGFNSLVWSLAWSPVGPSGTSYLAVGTVDSTLALYDCRALMAG